jgi:hypothetical protein
MQSGPRQVHGGCNTPQPRQSGQATQLDTASEPAGDLATPGQCHQLSILYAGGTHSFEPVAPEKVQLEAPPKSVQPLQAT